MTLCLVCNIHVSIFFIVSTRLPSRTTSPPPNVYPEVVSNARVIATGPRICGDRSALRNNRLCVQWIHGAFVGASRHLNAPITEKKKKKNTITSDPPLFDAYQRCKTVNSKCVRVAVTLIVSQSINARTYIRNQCPTFPTCGPFHILACSELYCACAVRRSCQLRQLNLRKHSPMIKASLQIGCSQA